MPNLWQELNLFPNKSSNNKVLCLGVNPKAFKLFSLLLWTIPLRKKPRSRPVFQQSQWRNPILGMMGTSQLFIQKEVLQQLPTQDDLRTRNRLVWFQNLQQCLPDGQCHLMTHTLPTLEFLPGSRGSVVLGKTWRAVGRTPLLLELQVTLEQCWQSSLVFSATPAVPQDVGKAWNILQQYNRSWRGKQRCPLQEKW